MNHNEKLTPMGAIGLLLFIGIIFLFMYLLGPIGFIMTCVAIAVGFYILKVWYAILCVLHIEFIGQLIGLVLWLGITMSILNKIMPHPTMMIPWLICFFLIFFGPYVLYKMYQYGLRVQAQQKQQQNNNNNPLNNKP